MKKAIVLALAAFAASAITASASSTAIHTSPASSTVGQGVTFTATFTSSCAGTASVHYFTIDGRNLNGTFRQTGLTGTETLSTASLTVGKHTVKYTWKVGACLGSATISYTVAALPPPTPSPPPSPSPTPTPTASPTPVANVTAASNDTPFLGYLGMALIALTIVSGIALAVFGRR